MEDCALQYDISSFLDIYSPVNYGYAAIYLSWSRFKPGVSSLGLQLGRLGSFSLTQILLQKST